MITVSQKSFVDLCEGEGIDCRVDYSGRGMFGRRCIGITGSAKDLMRFTLIVLPHVKVIESDDSFVSADDGETLIVHETWFDMHWDSMGLNTIFYWPWIQVTDDTQDEDEKLAEVRKIMEAGRKYMPPSERSVVVTDLDRELLK